MKLYKYRQCLPIRDAANGEAFGVVRIELLLINCIL